MTSYRGIALAALCVASAMHLDWHFARPAHHIWPASAAVIGSAAILAQLIEPLYERFIDGASYEWAFGVARQTAFATFTGVGLATHVLTVVMLRRRTTIKARQR
jgi:hypothetical protein